MAPLARRHGQVPASRHARDKEDRHIHQRRQLSRLRDFGALQVFGNLSCAQTGQPFPAAARFHRCLLICREIRFRHQRCNVPTNLNLQNPGECGVCR